jgi:uncharacterized membrane protein YhaH (DUF805 family)
MHFHSFAGKSDRFEWWTVSLVTDLATQRCLIAGFLTLNSDLPFRYPAAGVLWLGAALSLWLAVAVSVRRMRERGNRHGC